MSTCANIQSWTFGGGGEKLGVRGPTKRAYLRKRHLPLARLFFPLLLNGVAEDLGAVDLCHNTNLSALARR